MTCGHTIQDEKCKSEQFLAEVSTFERIFQTPGEKWPFVPIAVNQFSYTHGLT